MNDFRVKSIANVYDLERYLQQMEEDGWDIEHLLPVGDTLQCLVIHVKEHQDNAWDA